MTNFIVDNVFDNGGYTIDQYTINITLVDSGASFLIGSSAKPSHPQGVWSVEEGTYLLPEDIEEDDKNIGKEIEWYNLPLEVQKAVENYFDN